ncbi:MAG: tetratricopeptide repeat protein [Rhodobacter sp.]|nr:tetratricopeptide repeat protein [Rhodobacter sp.]
MRGRQASFIVMHSRTGFRHILALILALGLVSGCAGGLGAPEKGRKAAPGVDTHGDAVDGLTVGHRLMASGEYELALKAYYRAAGNQGLTVDVLSALGSANLKLGRLGQAEQLLRRAVKADPAFAPAWNNLGVVLMETGQSGEAERVFRTAFALDNGDSQQIRENLRLALAKLENPGYDDENNTTFALVRRGSGEYQLLSTP